ncbi:GlcG/HbpS family heme-binding protein [Algoriphagus persicinus]|uniref:GlcG/HbpS family heme-binding protein n=1 Tax=Algoriphagus persicinus TaxID=3108754 RepID=UPI002B3F7EF0|nr:MULTISPECIES: heme-binding protein [unclassified Algoriphagus]MEB2779665.1 heme-binding protein [Algoriphagus sp. C2-6-M1]MEB2785191.1 heme-binding protein [Algoriphagus sp. E1-3-M2]
MKNLVILILFIAPLFTQAQTQMQPYLSLEDATRISDAAQDKSKAEGWNMVIVVLDAGGHIIALRRMDGVQIGSIDVALGKAKTAVYFKRPTKVFEDMMKGEGGTRIATLPNAVAIEGGLPIFKDGVIVGAIGISGASSAQDGMVAAAALAVY